MHATDCKVKCPADASFFKMNSRLTLSPGTPCRAFFLDCERNNFMVSLLCKYSEELP
jgi:hypothetical protein